MKIDLVIDAHCPPQPGDGEERHAVLERLVARGDAFTLQASSLEDCLRVLFGIAREEPLVPAGDEWWQAMSDAEAEDWIEGR